jgi:hypothetical protein
MTRFSAAAAIMICLAFSTAFPAHSESKRSLATDHGCFPWQDFRNGQCVTKPAQTPPPALPAPAAAEAPAAVAPLPPPVAPPAPPVVANPCPDSSRSLSSQCVCPPDTHYEASSGRCLADSLTRAPELAIVCDGGTATGGTCVCPSGFRLMPATGNADGGSCVRTNAENCLGGELTASGKCLCNGQVTMDGETYLLEYSSGKCLPMRCPVTAQLRDGRCVSTPSPQLSAEPEPKARPAPSETKDVKETSDESESRQHCGRGMIRTRSGCVPARRREPDINESRLRQYYRNYQIPGMN